MGDEDRVETRRVEGERDPVADGLVGASLEHAAVDEHASARRLQQELGAGDGPGTAEELDRDRHARQCDGSDHSATAARRLSLPSVDIATVEEAWAELLRLSGDLVVSRARGAPLGPWSSTRSLARRYRAARRDFDGLLAAAAHAEARPADRAALASIRACLPWLDELEPMPPADQPAGDVQPDPHDAPLRRSVFRRYGRVGAAIRVDGEVVDRLTVFARLAREPDRDARRRLFLALEPLWRAVDGDGDRRSPYRELAGASARRWHETGSPIEANAAALGIDPVSVEAMLRRLLGAWRELLPPEPIEPWDYRYVCGAAARQLDPLVPLERLRPIHDAYVASLGADVEALGIGYDLFERPGRPVNSVAFAIGRGPVATGAGSWRARSPWVFATYREGGLGNLSELLHETGHAVHDAAVATRPAFFDFPLAMSAFVEGTADILGFDADEPAWQARWLGQAATPREALLQPLRLGHARRLLGALRARPPSRAGSPTQ